MIAGTLLGALMAPAAAAVQPPPLIIVMLENRAYGAAVGNSAMPYFNSLWNEGKNKTGRVTDYTQMYAVTHSSMLDYLAIASGSPQGSQGGGSAGQYNATSVWDQLTGAGVSWGVFEEGMPSTCYKSGSYNDTSAGGTDGQYVIIHNPATVFAPVFNSAECQHVQPLSALNTNALPQVSFVTPNQCDDDHGLSSSSFQNCVTGSTALLQRGDNWLNQHVTAWTAAGADVLITWDEGQGTAGPNGSTGGGQIAAMLTGPGVTPGQDATPYWHYSVLAGIENLYKLPLLLGAASSTPLPLPGAASPPPPPTVTITAPTGGTVSGTVAVSGTAQAQAQGATISKVQVSVDGGLPVTATGTGGWQASIDTTKLTNASHTITAQATDSNGQVGTTSVTVTVDNTSTTGPPTVTITAPAGGSTVSGAAVTVSGTAQPQGSATISGVQVSVDSGTPVPATGTTGWQASIDTTALTNASHTITAQATDSNGQVGTASVIVTVNNVSTTTACPAVPAGTTEFSGNVSLESSQSGWTGLYNSKSVLARVQPAGGSYDGLWALKVALKSGTTGAAGVFNTTPFWVPGSPGIATVAGKAYTGSAFVQANTAGENISLVVRERNASGTIVGSHTTTVTLTDKSWHQISSAYTAKGTGNSIRYQLYASNLASSSQNFLADCLSLQTP